jgi:hypothetical protein
VPRVTQDFFIAQGCWNALIQCSQF